MAEGALPGALAGITVVEASTQILGPMAAAMLGDQGADVIKVEGLEGDPARAMQEYAGYDASAGEQSSSIFEVMNRNKRGVAIDLGSAAGRGVLRELLGTADGLVEVAEDVGLDVDDVLLEGVVARETEGLGFGEVHTGALGGLGETPCFVQVLADPDGGVAVLADEVEDVVGGANDVPGVEGGVHAALGVVVELVVGEVADGGGHVVVELADEVVEEGGLLHGGVLSGRRARFGRRAGSSGRVGSGCMFRPDCSGPVVRGLLIGAEGRFPRGVQRQGA